jgi:hypothetical protein
MTAELSFEPARMPQALWIDGHLRGTVKLSPDQIRDRLQSVRRYSVLDPLGLRRAGLRWKPREEGFILVFSGFFVGPMAGAVTAADVSLHSGSEGTEIDVTLRIDYAAIALLAFFGLLCAFLLVQHPSVSAAVIFFSFLSIIAVALRVYAASGRDRMVNALARLTSPDTGERP